MMFLNQANNLWTNLTVPILVNTIKDYMLGLQELNQDMCKMTVKLFMSNSGTP